MDAELLQAFRDWSQAHHVACIESALEGGRRFLAAGKDSRKAAFTEARFSFSPEGTSLVLHLAAKAELSAFLSRLGPRGRGARLRVLSLGQPVEARKP